MSTPACLSPSGPVPVAFVLLISLSLASACNSTSPELLDVCAGIECSGHGQCQAVDEQPGCVCDPGYHAEQLQCLENDVQDPCLGVGCSGHGQCVVQEGMPQCDCEPGYLAEGLRCVAEAVDDPCLGVDCSAHDTTARTGLN